MYELTQEFIGRIVNEMELSQNIDRKKREYISEQIYDGNLWYYVKERLKQWYPKTYENYSISDYSVLKKIVDKKAKAYKEAPIRKLDTDTETTIYQDILKEGKLNASMKRVDKLFNQHKYCALAIFKDPILDDSDDVYGYKFVPLAPYTFDVIKDDEGCPQVFIVSYPDEFVTDGPFKDLYNPILAETGDADEHTSVLALWTETEHKLVRVTKSRVKGELPKFELIPIENNPEGVNPWGVLPFVFIPNEIDLNYPNPSPLPGQTVEVNALNSVYLTSGNMQIGQLILKYPADQDIQTVNQGLMSAIKLPQSKNPDDPETDANYISPTPNLSGHRESIMTFMNMILDEQGINVGQVITGTPDKYSSGFDRALANADVQGAIEDNQELYTQIENEIYEIIASIEAATGGINFTSKSLQIAFKKPKMLISDTDKLSNLKQMMDLGLLEDYEKFMIIDPNLTEEQAKEKAARINKGKKDLVTQFSNANK